MTVNTIPVCRIDDAAVAASLQEALGNAGDEVVLDFSSVRRVDASALRALATLADTAAQKNVKLGLRGVNVEVYKVLKLVKLSRRFAFQE
jgi:anti-anti-sigma regulatory factor